jgi:hypothetical protein
MYKRFHIVILLLCMVTCKALALPTHYTTRYVFKHSFDKYIDTPMYLRNKAMPYFAMRLVDSSMTYK